MVRRLLTVDPAPLGRLSTLALEEFSDGFCSNPWELYNEGPVWWLSRGPEPGFC